MTDYLSLIKKVLLLTPSQISHSRKKEKKETANESYYHGPIFGKTQQMT